MRSKSLCIFLCVWLILLNGMSDSVQWIHQLQAVCWAQSPSAASRIKPIAASSQIQIPPGQQIPGPDQTPVESGFKEEPPQQPAGPDDTGEIKPSQQVLPSVPASPAPNGQRPLSFTPMTPANVPAAIPGPAPSRGMITLNFDDADVFTIIQTIFGEVLKVNYVVDPRIKGRVTFRAVSPVPFEQVLPLMEVILRLNGIGVVEENNLYRLVPIGDVSKEPSPVSFGRDPSKIVLSGKALLQVVPILYVPSSEVLKLITPFASSNAVLVDVPKSNQIVIVDTDANVKRLLQLIDIFDNEKLKTTKPQVFVYPVQNGKAKDIATILQQTFLGAKSSSTTTATETTATVPTFTPSTPGGPTGQSPSTPSSSSAVYSSSSSSAGQSIISDFTKFIADETTNSIIILSTPEEYVFIKSAIDKIDIIPRQVVIEGMVAQVTLTDNLTLGLAGWINGRIGNFNVGGGYKGAKINALDFLKPFGTDFNLYAINDIGSMQFLITALAADEKAKLLATPHILVSDNREAKIQIGQQVPLVTSETYGSTTVAPQRTIQYRDIGIILKVKPRVNEGGLVSLDLYQEVSTYQTIKLYNNEDQIILNNNNAATNVVVQDGQTIIIGGLIRDDTTKNRGGIPFLSSIPFIGWLFGDWFDETKRTEIIILLTPRVIKNQKEANAVTNKYIDSIAGESQGRITKEELIKGRPESNSNSKRPK